MDIQQGAITFSEDLRRSSGEAMETLVRVGDKIGVFSAPAGMV